MPAEVGSMKKRGIKGGEKKRSKEKKRNRHLSAP